MIKFGGSRNDRRLLFIRYKKAAWCALLLCGIIFTFNAGGWRVLVNEPPYVLFKSQLKQVYGDGPLADSLADVYETQVLQPEMSKGQTDNPEAYSRANAILADRIGDVWLDRAGIALRINNGYFGVAHDAGWLGSSVISWLLLGVSVLIGQAFFRDLNLSRVTFGGQALSRTRKK